MKSLTFYCIISVKCRLDLYISCWKFENRTFWLPQKILQCLLPFFSNISVPFYLIGKTILSKKMKNFKLKKWSYLWKWLKISGKKDSDPKKIFQTIQRNKIPPICLWCFIFLWNYTACHIVACDFKKLFFWLKIV